MRKPHHTREPQLWGSYLSAAVYSIQPLSHVVRVGSLVAGAIVCVATMSGFHDDLSSGQTQALDSFKKQVQFRPEDLVGDDEDHISLRFLRARQFQVPAALELYGRYMKYRKTSNIDKILTAKLPKTELYRRFVPHAYHGFDKDGRPIYFEKVGAIDFQTALQYMSYDEMMVHHMWNMEHQIARCRESSARRGEVVDTMCSIIDLTGLSMSHRKGIHLIKLFAQHDQLFYPERLGKLYIVNAPWVFPFFWKICSAFLDANTCSKINVLGKNYKEELKRYVDPSQLPAEYGGTCECKDKEGGCLFHDDITDLKAGQQMHVDLTGVDGVQNQTVGRRDKWEKVVQIDSSGGVVDWAFTASKDVKFSVVVEHPAVDSKSQQEEEQDGATSHTIVPDERVTAHKGSYTTKRAATVRFLFDNTFSRFTSKAVDYVISVTELDEPAAPTGDEKLDLSDQVFTGDELSMFQIEVAEEPLTPPEPTPTPSVFEPDDTEEEKGPAPATGTDTAASS